MKDTLVMKDYKLFEKQVATSLKDENHEEHMKRLQKTWM